MRISRDRVAKKLCLSQESYVEKICQEFNCCGSSQRISVPLISDKMSKYHDQASLDEVKIYQRKVGSLIYASGVTRPDISRAVSHLAEFMTNPGPLHQEAVNHC